MGNCSVAPESSSAIRLYANLNRGTEDRSSSGFADARKTRCRSGFLGCQEHTFRRSGQQQGDYRGDRRRGCAGSRSPAGDTRGDWPRRRPPRRLPPTIRPRFSHWRSPGRVESLDLFWFEEPVPDGDVNGLCRIAAESGQRIAGGERLCGEERFAEYIDGPAVHILMPDIKFAAGLTPCRRIATAAAAAGIPISPHNPSGPVSTMASAHLGGGDR